MKNTLKGSMKKVMGTKIGKVAVGGTMAFMIFGGGIASASYVMSTFNDEKGQSVMATLTSMGENLMSEKAKKWWYKDDASDKAVKITALNGQVTTKDTEIATLKQQIAELQADADASAEQTAQITELESQVATLQAEKATLESQATTMQSDVETLNNEINQANTQMTELEAKALEYTNLYNGGERTNGGTVTQSFGEWDGRVNGNDQQKLSGSNIKNDAYQYDANGNPILPE